MRDPTDLTLATYESGVADYIDRSPKSVALGVASLLDMLVERCPAGRVLELGSGPGREADYLQGHGLTVDRTDACQAFVARLQRAGHPARVLDVRSDPLGGPFDAVVANAVLLHLDRDAFREALQTCFAATRPGGFLAITLKEGDGEAWSTLKLDAPRWFVYWRMEPLREALIAAGWLVLQLEHVPGRHEPWLHAFCQRPDRR